MPSEPVSFVPDGENRTTGSRINVSLKQFCRGDGGGGGGGGDGGEGEGWGRRSDTIDDCQRCEGQKRTRD